MEQGCEVCVTSTPPWPFYILVLLLVYWVFKACTINLLVMLRVHFHTMKLNNGDILVHLQFLSYLTQYYSVLICYMLVIRDDVSHEYSKIYFLTSKVKIKYFALYIVDTFGLDQISVVLAFLK